MAVNLRSDYRKFKNRCGKCGHRLVMHFQDGDFDKCSVVNGHESDATVEVPCLCRKRAN